MGQDRKLFWKRNCLRDLCKRSWEKREGNLCVCVCVCVSVCVFQFKNFHILRQRKPEQLFSLSLSLSLSHTHFLSFPLFMFLSFFFVSNALECQLRVNRLRNYQKNRKQAGKAIKLCIQNKLTKKYF